MAWSINSTSSWVTLLAFSTFLTSLLTHYGLRRKWKKISPVVSPEKPLLNLILNFSILWLLFIVLTCFYYIWSMVSQTSILDSKLLEEHRTVNELIASCDNEQGREAWSKSWDSFSLYSRDGHINDRAIIALLQKATWERGLAHNCWTSLEEALSVAEQSWLPVMRIEPRTLTQRVEHDPVKIFFTQISGLNAFDEAFLVKNHELIRERFEISILCHETSWPDQARATNFTTLTNVCPQGYETSFETEDELFHLFMVSQQIAFSLETQALNP